MKQVSFTEFRRNAASLFDSVEQGETIVVLRHGKPIAEVVPVPPADRVLSWKRPGLRLAAGPGVSLSREIIKERRSGNRSGHASDHRPGRRSAPGSGPK